MTIYQATIFAMFTILFAAQPPQLAVADPAAEAAQGLILRTQNFIFRGTRHSLELWRAATPPASTRSPGGGLNGLPRGPLVPYIPGSNIPLVGSVPYVLTDAVTLARPHPKGRPSSTQAGGKSRILYACYALIGIGYPRPICGVDFAWRPGTNDIYIVMTKSIMMNVQFFVFKASLKHSVGQFPFPFTTEKCTQWPRSPAAISGHKEILRKGFCGIAMVRVLLKGKSLLIYGRREDPKCPAVYEKYNLASKTWSGITSKREMDALNKAVEAEKRPARK